LSVEHISVRNLIVFPVHTSVVRDKTMKDHNRSIYNAPISDMKEVQQCSTKSD